MNPQMLEQMAKFQQKMSPQMLEQMANFQQNGHNHIEKHHNQSDNYKFDQIIYILG